jgi:hypothetical protein
MATTIEWMTDYKQALQKAKAEGKFILADFFNPG